MLCKLWQGMGHRHVTQLACKYLLTDNFLFAAEWARNRHDYNIQLCQDLSIQQTAM